MCSWRTHETGDSQLLSLGTSSLSVFMVWTEKQHHQRLTQFERSRVRRLMHVVHTFVHLHIVDHHCSLERFQVQW